MIKKKYVYFILLFLPSVLSSYEFSDRMWLLIAQGKTLSEHGLYAAHPLHETVSCIYQDWLLSYLYNGIYQLGGAFGVMLLMLLTSFAVSLLSFRLCYLLSHRESLSFGLAMVAAFYRAFLPVDHHLSIVFFLSGIVLFLLFNSPHKNPVRKLFLFGFISVLYVNIQGLFFPIIAIFVLLRFIVYAIPFLFNKSKDIKSTFFTFIYAAVVLLCSLLNPYGKKIYSLWYSYWNTSNADILSTPDLKLASGKIIYSLLFLLITLIYLFRQKGKPSIFSGCILFISVYFVFRDIRLFPVFIFGAVAFLAELLCNVRFSLPNIKIPFKPLCIFFALLLLAGSGMRLCHDLSVQEKQHAQLAAVLDGLSDKKSSVFAPPDQAGYLAYRGFAPFIDARTELFLTEPMSEESEKAPCVYTEYRNLLSGKLYYRDFLDRYEFEYLYIKNEDLLFTYLTDYNDTSPTHIYTPIAVEEKHTLFQRIKK